MVLFSEPGDGNNNTGDEEPKLDCLVADSAAFLRNADLHNLSHKVFTVREVVGEIRDSVTKQRLAVLPYELNVRTPSAESLHVVTEFSKKTGDYKSLSAVDLRVLALTYQLEKEYGDADSINTHHEKKPVVIEKRNVRSDKEISGFFVESRKPKDEKDETTEQDDTSKEDDSAVPEAVGGETEEVGMETNDPEIAVEPSISVDEGNEKIPSEDAGKEASGS